MRISPLFTSMRSVMCWGVMMLQSSTQSEMSTMTPSCTSLVRGREAMSPAPSAACMGPSRCMPTWSEVSTRWETIRFVCSVCV
jgi:hypothetical protein